MTDHEILDALCHARLMLPCLNLTPPCTCAACRLDLVIAEMSRRIAASERSRLS